MKFIYLFISLFIVQSLLSQNEEWKPASKESEAYHEARMKLTNPPYGLAKVQSLISDIKNSDEDDSRALGSKIYMGLALREKFTYNMIHGESYSQNCDAMPLMQDEHKKIFSYLPDAFGEYNWSIRQKDFFTEHKDSVLVLMKESIIRTNKVGLNYKEAIIEINAVKMIPVLVDVYKKNTARRDLDILTIFMLLMKENKYEPFLKSASFTKLYGDENSYESYLNYNKANEDLIIERVMGFYNGYKK
jgi:hypothetical protein